MVAGEKWGEDIGKPSTNCTVLIYNTASAGRLKKLDRIHREGIRIYTGAFRTSPVESLHVETNDRLLEERRNELGLGFLYKLKSNTSYIKNNKMN